MPLRVLRLAVKKCSVPVVSCRGGKRKAPKPADCVLRVNGHVLGVLEAKKASKGYTSGVGQAKDYAQRTNARYAYSTTLQSQS